MRREEAEPEIRDADRRACSRRRAQTTPLSLYERETLIVDVLNELFGLGPLEALLQDPTISDILVNRLRPGLRRARTASSRRPTSSSSDDRHLMQIIERIVSAVGRRIDESSPMVDARLPDGSRVNAIIPPLALDGPALSIRRFRTDRLGAEDLVERESLTQPMLDFLQAAVACRLNIIVSGGTGAGKTTLLNILSSFISRQRAHRHDRGRGRADAAAAPRRPARDAAAEHRRQGRGPAARPRRSTPCACGPTASSSARSAARKRSTCCRP